MKAYVPTVERREQLGQIEYRVRFDPYRMELRIPSHVRPPASPTDEAIEIARQLIAQSRADLTQLIFSAVFGGGKEAKDFDFNRFEESEFEKLRREHADLKRHAEHLASLRRAYQGFMEASGKSWEALERSVMR